MSNREYLNNKRKKPNTLVLLGGIRMKIADRKLLLASTGSGLLVLGFMLLYFVAAAQFNTNKTTWIFIVVFLGLGTLNMYNAFK